MVYTVTLNTSLDYLAYTDGTEEGKIHKITDYELMPGGKGINVSQVLNSLDIPNEALGFVAGTTGECLISLLEEIGVQHRLIRLKNGITRINVKLRKSTDAGISETDFNGTGPFITKEELNIFKEMFKDMTQNDYIIISGSVPGSISMENFDEILCAVNSTGAKLIVDISGAYLRQAIAHKPFLIKPNEDEIRDVLGIQLESEEDVNAAADSLLAMGAENVLISLGEKGACFASKTGERYRMQSASGELVNTVGAGDSMLAGFVAEYLKNGDYESAVRMSVCAGSAAAFSKGLATKDKIKVIFDGLFR